MTKSRANGTGSAYQRVKGRDKPWTVQVTVGYKPNGQPIYKRKGGFKTRTEALKAIEEVRAMEKKKVDKTIAYYYKAFEKGKGAKISEDKQRAYRIAYNRMEQYWGTPLSELTIMDMQDLINDKCSTYYPARDMKTLFSHMFKLAALDGLPNHTLPSLLEIPPLNEKEREPFTDEEQLKLWYSYEAGNMNAALPLIMIYTGMMTCEIRGLKKDMIDLAAGEITNAGRKTNVRKKTAIILPPDIVPVITDVIQNTDGDLLYPMKGDDDFYQYYYQALKDAGIERHLTPYSCRHTMATALAVDKSVAPQTVQRIMRWASTKMMDRYVHPKEEDARKAVQKL